MDSEITLGLDFGTSTTLVALPGNRRPEILSIGTTTTWLPSVLSSTDGVNWIIGEDADAAFMDTQVRSPKSAITHNLDELTNDRGVSIKADDAIRQILIEVVSRCKSRGFENFDHVRVSCPAMWDGNQRQRLINLVNEAGLTSDIDNIIDEPIAASIAWWWTRFSKGLEIHSRQRAVIFDLGGGTLDVAVVDIYPKPGMPEMTILSARGIDIAGDKLDEALRDVIIVRLLEEKQFDVAAQTDTNLVKSAIARGAREVKEALSFVQQTKFSVDPAIARVPIIEVTRSDLNNVYEPQLRRALRCLDAALREARMKQGDNLSGPQIGAIPIETLGGEIDFVVLAGGMSQIPLVLEQLQKMMPRATVESASHDLKNSTAAIAEGVANQSDFADLNIHRPNFDFIIEWTDRSGGFHSEIIYPAFTPLYLPEQVARGETELGFTVNWKPRENPLGQVALRVRSIGGRDIAMSVSGGVQAGKLREALMLDADRLDGIHFKLFASGKIIIQDRMHREYVMRINKWPFIRFQSKNSESAAVLELEPVLQITSSTPSYDPWRYK